MASPRPVYLDHHATTPCDPRVVDAMTPYFSREFGNPASRSHAWGWRAEEAVERARVEVAGLIGAQPREIVFTSGATEANNLALFGVLRAAEGSRRRLVVCTTEHKAVLDPAAALEREGVPVTRVRVGTDGRIDLDRLAAAIGDDARLVSVMHANNEIGVLQPLEEVSRLARTRGVLLHTDAAQSAGKIPVDVDRLGVDLLSISGHKIYGPKGVGALYVRRRTPRIRIRPLFFGGGHERGLRSGTLPVPLLVGLGHACGIARGEMEGEGERLRALGRRLLEHLAREIEPVLLNGDPDARLPGSLNLRIPGIEANALVLGLSDVGISTGSACTSASPEPSHVLLALGLGREEALESIRIALGRSTTEADVAYAAGCIVTEVRRLRGKSPGPLRRAGLR